MVRYVSVRRRGLNWLVLMLFSLGCLFFVSEGYAGSRSWSVKKTIPPGEKFQIQRMYNINSDTCVADKVPPKPTLSGSVKLGNVSFRSGKTNPHQCPSVTINANFANYTAGAKTGTDRFKIVWRSSKNGPKYTVRYTIKIK